MLSKLPKPVKLSYNWVLTNFRYQEPEIYARLFDESEKIILDMNWNIVISNLFKLGVYQDEYENWELYQEVNIYFWSDPTKNY